MYCTCFSATSAASADTDVVAHVFKYGVVNVVVHAVKYGVVVHVVKYGVVVHVVKYGVVVDSMTAET